MRKFKKSEEMCFLFIIASVSILLLSFISLVRAYETEKSGITLWYETLSGTSYSSLYFIQNFIYKIMFINNVLTTDLIKFVDSTYKNFEYNLLKNPDIENTEIWQIITYFIRILGPIYITAIISIGIYLTFISGSSYERAKAKFYLLKLIFSMIFISISGYIIQFLIYLSSGLTLVILSLGPAEIIDTHKISVFYVIKKIQVLMLSDVSLGFIPLIFSLFLASGAFMILVARYFFVIIFSVTLPLAIFLLSFELTKRLGKFLIQQLLCWIFLQVIFSMTIIAIALGESSVHWIVPELRDFQISGTLALILVPIGTLYLVIRYIAKNVRRFLDYYIQKN